MAESENPVCPPPPPSTPLSSPKHPDFERMSKKELVFRLRKLAKIQEKEESARQLTKAKRLREMDEWSATEFLGEEDRKKRRLLFCDDFKSDVMQAQKNLVVALDTLFERKSENLVEQVANVFSDASRSILERASDKLKNAVSGDLDFSDKMLKHLQNKMGITFGRSCCKKTCWIPKSKISLFFSGVDFKQDLPANEQKETTFRLRFQSADSKIVKIFIGDLDKEITVKAFYETMLATVGNDNNV
jgi:hypothetical protein